jgi:ABC-type uncharacterized transport system permease subunit
MLDVNVSGYCRALHDVHVVNYPATGLGGGVLEGIFLVPVLVVLLGLVIALRRRQFEPLKSTLYLSSAVWAFLLVLAFVAASTTSLYTRGP